MRDFPEPGTIGGLEGPTSVETLVGCTMVKVVFCGGSVAPDPRMLAMAAAETAVDGAGGRVGTQGVGWGALDKSSAAPGIFATPGISLPAPAVPEPEGKMPGGAAAAVPAVPEPPATALRAIAPALPGKDDTECASLGPVPSAPVGSGANMETSVRGAIFGAVALVSCLGPKV